MTWLLGCNLTSLYLSQFMSAISTEGGKGSRELDSKDSLKGAFFRLELAGVKCQSNKNKQDCLHGVSIDILRWNY